MMKIIKEKKSTGKIKILLVDDHPIVLAGLRMLIQTRPEFEVSNAVTTLAKASEALRKNKPDLMVLDLNMQESNGIDFLP